MGEHKALIQSSGKAIERLLNAIAWLKKKVPLTDTIEHEIDDLIQNDILKLFRCQIETHLKLDQFDEAEDLLNQVKQLPQANRGLSVTC